MIDYLALTEPTKIKLQAGNKRFPVIATRHGKRLVLQFPYNPELLKTVKAMDGAKWHGHDNNPPKPVGKWWSIALSNRNLFQLDHLTGGNPYARYDLPLIDVKREMRCGHMPYDHQFEGISHILTRRHCVLGYEMGTGKTLVSIIAVEMFVEMTGPLAEDDYLYVGPRSALKAVELEFIKWKAKHIPTFMTYEGLTRLMQNWLDGKTAPRILILDESSRVKNPSAQRGKAALDLANGMRDDHGENCLIVPMSGSPSPKSPIDWWNQCEIACPGFLKEGNIRHFERRLALVVDKQKIDGGTYPERVSWLDDEDKCAKCGKLADAPIHDFKIHHDSHVFTKSVNEVSYLYKRMQGLVDIKLKKDCLDLPDKTYLETIVPPSKETLRLARILQKRATSVIQALTWLRELSDGFQYVDEETGEEQCEACHGKGTQIEYYDPEDPEDLVSPYDVQILEGTATFQEIDGTYYVDGTSVTDIDSWLSQRARELSERLKKRDVACFTCNGTCKVKTYKRAAKSIECPKIEVIKDRLDELSDIGRYVLYAGFFGSVDRCVETCQQQGWHVIRADGRGWKVFNPDGKILDEHPLVLFQEKLIQYPRVAFVGQPDAAGMGLTLTASPRITYYSNSFNAEGRIQSEDRIHRAGMDTARGATIEDLLHLDSDRLVLDNLRKKRKLQSMTMGDMEAALRTYDGRVN